MRLPALIDVHVHLREPGATQKEDFSTGTRAAVKGGFGFVIDMPNNPGAPTITAERLEEKIELSKKAHCGVGFHFGTNGKNMEEFAKIMDNPHVFGLKIYMNHTTGELLVEEPEDIFKAWECQKPILVHAEGEMLKEAIALAKQYNRKLHICHVSLSEEVELIRNTKHEQRIPITAGVTPHHLFLTGNFSMKPPINTAEDKAALWQGIADKTIDLIENDHAPHTAEERAAGAFGVPGLETALGLMGLAIHEKRITKNDIQRLMHDNPKKIFNIPDTEGHIEVDFETSYTVAGPYETKSNWSPFEGWTLYGTIETRHIN